MYLDTHVVAWLYAGRVDLFPEPVRRLLNERELLVSPMVLLELQYLYELGRVTEPAGTVIDTLATALGARVCDQPFRAVVSSALPEGWTRDPFDRVIVGHAESRQAELLTRDETLHEHYRRAIWGDAT